MKKVFVGLSLVAILASTTSADVFDDNKEGFLLSLGVGATSVSTDFTVQNFINVDERNIGVASSFKLGYGLSDQLSIYYTNQVDWYDFDGESTVVGLTGVGIDYRFDDSSPFYSTAMIGAGSISDIKDSSTSRGFAYAVGFGYDIAPHISVEATYMNVNIDEDNTEVDTDSFRVNFNYTWY